MSDKEETEIETIKELKNSTFAIQWIIVIFVMIVITGIINKSFGSMRESFFCVDLTNNKWITSGSIMSVFSLLSFLVIFITRQKSKDRNIPGLTKEENTETLEDTIPYLIISVAGYLYSLSYIKKKFQANFGGGGSFSDTYDKLENIQYGTITLYIGILLMFVNIMSYIFLYLKDKKNNRKNKYARSIYFGQISTLITWIIAGFFILGFGCETIRSNPMSIIIALIKWTLVVLSVYFGIKMINKNTDGEDWFGGTKEENENENEKDN